MILREREKEEFDWLKNHFDVIQQKIFILICLVSTIAVCNQTLTFFQVRK